MRAGFWTISASSLVAVLVARSASAECQPEPGGKCLTAAQFADVRAALQELDSIKSSEMTGQFLDRLVIVNDWQGRTFVNGGKNEPLRLKIKVGTIDRTLGVVLDSDVFYRPAPAEPAFGFRTRFRAQAGLLAPMILSPGGSKPFDIGASLDFVHLRSVNVDVFVGFNGIGPGVGLDLTKNFGMRVGYELTWSLSHQAFVGAYFSFN